MTKNTDHRVIFNGGGKGKQLSPGVREKLSLTKEIVTDMVGQFENNDTKTRLVIIYCSINDDDAFQLLLEEIKENKSLVDFHFPECDLTENTVLQLARALKGKNIHSLVLDRNPKLGDNGLLYILQALETVPIPNFISFTKCGLTDRSAILFREVLLRKGYNDVIEAQKILAENLGSHTPEECKTLKKGAKKYIDEIKNEIFEKYDSNTNKFFFDHNLFSLFGTSAIVKLAVNLGLAAVGVDRKVYYNNSSFFRTKWSNLLELRKKLHEEKKTAPKKTVPEKEKIREFLDRYNEGLPEIEKPREEKREENLSSEESVLDLSESSDNSAHLENTSSPKLSGEVPGDNNSDIE